jgi:TatD DNase family protein
MLTDSHCHLTAAQFEKDRPAVLERASGAGVGRMVSIASSVADARRAALLAAADSRVWNTVGVHPHEVDEADLEVDVARLEELARGERVVAIGETGLDFHYDNAPRNVQIEWFEAHLALAEASGFPLVVHSRSADDETRRIVEMAGRKGVRGVLHCFTGGDALLEAALEADWFLGYGGIATFKRFDGGRLLARVPEDRLLLETDAPYLAPVPMRGKRNEPAFLVHTRDRIAALRGISAERLERATSSNASRLFGLGNAGSIS